MLAASVGISSNGPDQLWNPIGEEIAQTLGNALRLRVFSSLILLAVP